MTCCCIFLLTATGCPTQYPISTVYEKIQMPKEMGQDIQLRLRRQGPRGKEELQYIDLSYDNKDCRLYIGSPPSYWIMFAENKKVICKEQPVLIKTLGENYGYGSGPGGTTEEWLETTQDE